jgi:HAE1 family hydrophobic/amphiphilic exporter-1
MTPKEATKACHERGDRTGHRHHPGLVAVFIPVAVMGGITGLLYQQFAITVAVSVVFSSINALTLSPALCILLLKAAAHARAARGLFQTVQQVFDKTTSAYTGFTTHRHPQIAIGLAFMRLS